MKTPTRSEIDAVVKYVAGTFAASGGRWFSVKGGHGWSEFDALSPSYFEFSSGAKAGEVFDWAARLGFLDASMKPGSGGYSVYRLTHEGERHAAALRREAIK
jgi:hypothetical protein